MEQEASYGEEAQDAAYRQSFSGLRVNEVICTDDPASTLIYKSLPTTEAKTVHHKALASHRR